VFGASWATGNPASLIVVLEMTTGPSSGLPRLSARLGIVAHDAKKDELLLFARAHADLLDDMSLWAPEDTAHILEEAGREVRSLAPDCRGGDIQLAAAVVDGSVDGVIFLRDPLLQLSGEPQIDQMLKACDLENIPIATNLTAASMLVRHLHGVVSSLHASREGGVMRRADAQVFRLPRHPSGRRKGSGPGPSR